jgi:hypothetical protein
MNRSTLGAMWCLTIVLCPVLQALKPGISSAEAQKLREVVAMLRAFSGELGVTSASAGCVGTLMMTLNVVGQDDAGAALRRQL